jgi:5-carboxymethyl-2-hydroxymuconic-semialdehyde dehydrogenase
MLSTWEIAPALAAGCTVVHKPAVFSPLSAAILAECAQAAGLPNGVWNMVNRFGEAAGKALTEHPVIKAVAFVGETTTGSMIRAQGAPTLKRVHFELGGKNPVLVFDDADIERALDAVVFMIYSLKGQRCTSSSRLLLHSSIKGTFIAKLKERVSLLKIGHPLDVNTEVGPLIHPTHLDKVLSYLDSAEQEGANVLRGSISSDAPEDGYYFAPTLIIDVDNKMKVVCEETFGPVLSVITFDNEGQATPVALCAVPTKSKQAWFGSTPKTTATFPPRLVA